MSLETSVTPPLEKAFAAADTLEQARRRTNIRSRSRSKNVDERIAALQKGFGSFVDRPEASAESRSGRHRKLRDGRRFADEIGDATSLSSSESDVCESQSLRAEWGPPALQDRSISYIDIQGRPDVLDDRGLIKPGVFYKERSAPLKVSGVLGVRSKGRHSRSATQSRQLASRMFSSPQRSPPRRRYFGKKFSAQREGKNEITYVDHSSWMQLEATGQNSLTTEHATKATSSSDTCDSFLPFTLASQLASHCPNTKSRAERQEALHLKCRQTPDNPEVWLQFAEFQWSSLQEELGASSRQVREKQRSIVEAGLEACPGDIKLLCAAACAEGDECAGLNAETVHASRRARLLACAHADAAEELVWTYITGSARAYGEEVSPIDAIRKAALDSLGVLAARKIVAGHDGRTCMALERAELAAISATAFAEAATGNSGRALALLRAQATLCTFFPGREADALRDVWTKGCRLGDPSALYLLQSLRLVEAAWSGSPAAAVELPPELSSLAELLEKGASVDVADCSNDAGSGCLSSLLRAEGGRMRCWLAEEFLRTASHISEEVPYDDIAPFLVCFRGDVSRREAVLRYLDMLGSPALARHLPGVPYRRAFSNIFSVLELRMPSAGKTSHDSPVKCGGLPAFFDRPGLLARSALQSLLTWPKDPLLLESLLAALWNWRKGDVKLPRRVLKASEDTRLYFDYAQGLWMRSNYDAARAVFLKLCHTGTGGVDARIAIAWWHLEMCRSQRLSGKPLGHSSASTGMPPRAFRILCALAKGRFEATILSESALGSDAGMHRLQATSRLEQVLVGQSRIDAGGFRFFVSSHHAVVVALCALIAHASPQRSLEIFLTHAPSNDGHHYNGQTILGGKAKSIAEEHRCNTLAMGLFIEALLVTPAVKPHFLRRVVWIALHRDPQSPWLLRVLVAAHLQSGTVGRMRRDLDRALHLHRAPSLLVANCCTPAGLRVALEAEMCLPAPSPERLTALCECASEAGAGMSFFSGPIFWSLYHMAFFLKARIESFSQLNNKDFELRRRVAVRAMQRHPYAKSLWLLQLAAWEARTMNLGSSKEDEEEVLDLIEAMEASKICLVGDPLEAVA